MYFNAYLPDVKKEKAETDLMHEIEKGAPLKKVETVEKNPLPTKEGASSFTPYSRAVPFKLTELFFP